MRLRSGRVVNATRVDATPPTTNIAKKYFDYESDPEDYDPEYYDPEVNPDISPDVNPEINLYESDTESDTENRISTKKPYHQYIMNRIHTFMDIKKKYIATDKYYIELARAITELYDAMNTYFDDWIYDMYHDNKNAYRILKIANEKAHTFIRNLMDELTTSTNILYKKQENIKIIHCSLNEMREFVNRFEEYLLHP